MQCRAHLPALTQEVHDDDLNRSTGKPLPSNPQQSALIVVDMQNAYATPGGYLDLAGFDVSTTRPVIANIQTAVTAARAAGMLIIWFQNGWDEQYVEAGGPGSPNFHKSNALKTMRKQPQLQGKLLAKGSWIINWWMNCAAAWRYCAAEAALQRFLQYAAGQHFAQPWNTPSGFHRYRYQRLRRIDATRWLFSGVFRRGAGRRNTPGGA